MKQKGFTSKELRKWENRELDNKLYDKIEGDLESGAKVILKWKEDIEDGGYLYQTGECDIDSYFVHIPNPSNEGGKDSCDPEFIHINNLLANEWLLKIIVVNP